MAVQIFRPKNANKKGKKENGKSHEGTPRSTQDAPSGASSTIKYDTIMLSGGAQTSPLIAGFLYAALEKDKQFKEFHVSGAGALMALLSISPKVGRETRIAIGVDSNAPIAKLITENRHEDVKRLRLTALRNWVESGVSDEIYENFPINYKLFRKPGPFSPLYQQIADRFKIPVGDPDLIAIGNGSLQNRQERFRSMLESPGGSNPLTRLLANLLTAAHADGTQKDSSNRHPADRLLDRVIELWQSDRSKWGDPDQLLSKKDPIKRLRDDWLASWLTTPQQRRTYNDIVDFWFAALTPTTLNVRSKGLAAPLPFLEEIVDFESLPEILKTKDIKIFMNAYNVTKRSIVQGAKDRDALKGRDDSMEEFSFDKEKRKNEIDAERIRAAFSFPFIYPPARIGENTYSEAAYQQPIYYEALYRRINCGNWPGHGNEGKRGVVLLDTLGILEDYILRPPRDLWDAYVISILTPVVKSSQRTIRAFNYKIEAWERKKKGNKISVQWVDWDVPIDAQGAVMDWSYSNLSTLFRLGKERADTFFSHVSS